MKKLILVGMCLLSVCFAEERYMCQLEISQSSCTLDIWQYMKDAANTFTITIPVDKQFYNSIKKGETLKSNFKGASFMIDGSIKEVNVRVKNKWITQK